MRVFISWSGERSKALAVALRDWLPLVVHYVEPWLSDEDIEAGERWGSSVATELAASNFGIVCVTSENVSSPWVLFEAGALTKSLDESKVIPLLLDLEFSDISGPLAQFQAKKLTQSGLVEVIASIQKSADEAIPEDRVNRLFSGLWSDLEQKIGEIPSEAPTERHVRPQHEVLEELVASIRSLDARVRESEERLSEVPYRQSRRGRRFHPMMLRELQHSIGDGPDDPVGILFIASMLREDAPWLYELAVDAYRALMDQPRREADRALKRLERAVDGTFRGPFPMEEMGLDPMLAEMVSHELPRYIERALHRGPSDRPDERDGP